MPAYAPPGYQSPTSNPFPQQTYQPPELIAPQPKYPPSQYQQINPFQENTDYAQPQERLQTDQAAAHDQYNLTQGYHPRHSYGFQQPQQAQEYQQSRQSQAQSEYQPKKVQQFNAQSQYHQPYQTYEPNTASGIYGAQLSPLTRTQQSYATHLPTPQNGAQQWNPNHSPSAASPYPPNTGVIRPSPRHRVVYHSNTQHPQQMGTQAWEKVARQSGIQSMFPPTSRPLVAHGPQNTQTQIHQYPPSGQYPAPLGVQYAQYPSSNNPPTQYAPSPFSQQ